MGSAGTCVQAHVSHRSHQKHSALHNSPHIKIKGKGKNIRYELDDQHLLYHVSCMRQNCCPAIFFTRCPKELSLSRTKFRKAVKNWASVSWLFMWNNLLISCFTDPNYFVPAPLWPDLSLGVLLTFCYQAASSVLACCSQCVLTCSHTAWLVLTCSFSARCVLTCSYLARCVPTGDDGCSRLTRPPNPNPPTNPILAEIQNPFSPKTQNLSPISSEIKNVRLPFSPLFTRMPQKLPC